MEKKTSTIWVDTATKERLKKLLTPDTTYDQVINKLLDSYSGTTPPSNVAIEEILTQYDVDTSKYETDENWKLYNTIITLNSKRFRELEVKLRSIGVISSYDEEQQMVAILEKKMGDAQ